jgi:acyl-CoA hydrolase
MENHKLVLPEDLNQFGYLFGGTLLKWVDEYAWIAASLDYPECNFVTIGMDEVEFRRSVKKGAILKFISEKTRQGNTSVQYEVTAFQGRKNAEAGEPIFSTHVTFVNVDHEGRKAPLPQ